MELVYYEGANVTLRGAFEIDNEKQTPDSNSAKIKIMERGRSVPYLAEIAATISGKQILYKVSNLRKGVFRAFILAEFSSGADKRTGTIDYVVRSKTGR